MIITLSNNKQLRGDLVRLAILRNDLAPIPATFQAQIKVDSELQKLLAEGQTITVGNDKFYIVKSKPLSNNRLQDNTAIEIICFLDNVHKAAFVRQTAIIKENSTLSVIYRAAGATLKSIESDFTVDRFYCYQGQYPSHKIAQILQQQGGVVRWKNGKIGFIRYADIIKQKPVLTLPNTPETDSGFLEHHQVPAYYSLDKDGKMVSGSESVKPKSYVPGKNAQQLVNMSKSLVYRKTEIVSFDARICAGDVVSVQNSKQPLVIVTACHVIDNSSGGAGGQYSKLFLYQ